MSGEDDNDSELMYDEDYDVNDSMSDVMSVDSDDDVRMEILYSDSEEYSSQNSNSSDSSSSESSSEANEILDSIPTAAENQQPIGTGSVTAQQHAESTVTQLSAEPAVTHLSAESTVTQPSAESSATHQVQETSTTLKTNNEGLTEDDAFSCPICLEGLTNTGPHKPACLKCGHIFGINCLQRWIKVGCNSDARRCPTCNTKASLKDIRLLYAKKLVAIDTAELTALEVKLAEERRENSVMKTEIEKCKLKHESLTNEVQRLKTLVEEFKSGQPSTSGPATSRTCLKKISLTKTRGCRVLAFNKNSMLLVASQHSESPLFPSHIIRKINASILELSKECIYAHKKPIRDMAFHPIEQNLLASVSLDKCANLIDFTSNIVVSSIEVGEPLWSCCWAGNNSNMLVAGGQSGSLFYIDKRFMKLLNSQCIRKPACVSLVSLPPSNTRSVINGGFLKTRLDIVSVFEQNSGSDCISYKESELPLKGFWTSSSYDSNANLMLFTSKPCGTNKSLRHIVSRISNFNEEGPVVQPVITFYGGTKATLLSRSCIVPSYQPNEDTLVCCNDEISSTVKLFSINSGKNVHSFKVKETFLDLCPLNGVLMNGGRRSVAGLSDNALSIFSV